VSELAVILFNETRWESRYQVLKRFIALKSELIEVLNICELMSEWKDTVGDFLSKAFFVRCAGYLHYLKEMNKVSKFYQTVKFPTGCFVPLMILHLMQFSTPSTEMDPPYLLDFKSTMNKAVGKYMFKPIICENNNFLKASLLHPEVALIVCREVSSKMIATCFDSIYEDALALEDEKERITNSMFIKLSLKYYNENIIGSSVSLPLVLPWARLFENGCLIETSHLQFWHQVANNGLEFHNAKCCHLLKVVSLLLAQPAGESIDESTFSSVGGTMRRDRLSLSPNTIEQITILRMFIRNFKWNPTAIQEWLELHNKNK
jgi:hypothetical protein